MEKKNKIFFLEKEDLKNNKIESLRCNNCDEWLKLILGEQIFKIGDITINVKDFPILDCPKCCSKYLPNQSLKAIDYWISEAEKFGKKAMVLSFKPEVSRKKRFDYCKDVEFKYDPIDYYHIPGLWRPWNEGYLTPVFFNKDLLIKFYNHPDYLVEFSSDTYGLIRTKGIAICFGINRSGKIILWLGEIEGLSYKEKLYLASNNIDSDHDIASEFYQGQIEAIFTEPSKEEKIIEELNKFNEKVFKKYNIKLLQLDNEAIPIMGKIKKPIFYNEEEVGKVIEAFFKLLIERINTQKLKRNIGNLKELKDLGGIRTFEEWLVKKMGFDNAKKSIEPLFILYDLRKISAHLFSETESQKLLKECIERLSLSSDVSYEEIYKSLLDKLFNFYLEINSFIKEKNKTQKNTPI
jgi:hypothetical protein